MTDGWKVQIMVDAVATPPVRRHGLLALIIAGALVVLMGAFVLLWFKLPVWTPEWVIEHSPWADPIVRAVEEDSANKGRAVERLGRMGASQVPRLLVLIDHPDDVMRELASACLEHIQDERIIQPLMDRLLKNGEDSHIWIAPLAEQDPTAVADLLVRHLVTGETIHINALHLGAVVADDRVVARLQAILEQPWVEGEIVYKDDPQPLVAAAIALVDSPCASAVPALLQSYASPDPAIRLRVVDGIKWNRRYGRHSSSAEQRPWDARLQQLMLRALTDPDLTVRELAASTMNQQRVDGAEPLLIEMTRSPDSQLRISAISGLNARWYGPAAHRRIIECLKDPSHSVQITAISACKYIDDLPLATELLEVLASSDEQVRAWVYVIWNSETHLKDPRLFPVILRMMDDPVRRISQRAEEIARSAASSPEQKRAVEEASRRLKERNERDKQPADSPGTR